MQLDLAHGLSIFEGISSSELGELLKGSSVLRTEAGERLFSKGQEADFFGYVLSGAYKLTLQDPSDEEVIMHFGVRGESLGIMATMEGESLFPFDAVAMWDSTFLAIPRRTFKTTWLNHPVLMNRFQTDLQGRIYRCLDEKRLGRRPLSERTADLLLHLSDDKSSRSGKVELPITRREIASYVGATVESVIRNMAPWIRSGIIQTASRQILIRNRKALIRIRDGEPDKQTTSGLKDRATLASLWKKTRVSAFRSK
jgi:CRP-like cAMP-binding protein